MDLAANLINALFSDDTDANIFRNSVVDRNLSARMHGVCVGACVCVSGEEG